MENFKELPLEVRLSAYIDGQVSEEDKRELETILATDPHARELLDLLNAGSEFGNQAFAEMLREPVPLHLVRAIKATPAGSGGGLSAANNNKASFFRFIPQTIAASAVLLLAGGYSGYFIGMNSATQPNPVISEIASTQTLQGATGSKTRELKLSFDAPAMASLPAISVASVAGTHDVYSRETTRLAELPAADADSLKTWLAASTGIPFNIPDLSADGLTFQGGRLVAVDGNPAGALYYKDASGDVVGVYFTRGTVTRGETSEGANQYVAGSKGDTAWIVAGPNGDDALKAIADKASAAL